MNDYDAVMIAEGVTEPKDQHEYFEAWQHLINTGMAWKLQGWFGREAQRLIDAGICKHPL